MTSPCLFPKNGHVKYVKHVKFKSKSPWPRTTTCQSDTPAIYNLHNNTLKCNIRRTISHLLCCSSTLKLLLSATETCKKPNEHWIDSEPSTIYMADVKACEMVGNKYSFASLVIQLPLMVNTSINIKEYQSTMLNADSFLV